VIFLYILFQRAYQQELYLYIIHTRSCVWATAGWRTS